jgi:hypothetical protein
MRRGAIRTALALAASLGSMLIAASADKPDPKDLARVPDLVLTEKDFDKEFAIKRGELVEIRLLATLPLMWSRIESNDIFRQVKGFPIQAAPIADKNQEQTLSGHFVCVHRFEVAADPNPQTSLKLLYSKFGRPELTYERLKNGEVPPAPEFRRDQSINEVREGMVFQAKFKRKD